MDLWYGTETDGSLNRVLPGSLVFPPVKRSFVISSKNFMEVDKQRRTRCKLPQRLEKDDKLTAETEEGNVNADENGEHMGVGALQASIAAIHAEIIAVRSDVKMELCNFCDSLTRDLKEELANFREEVNEKLSKIAKELKETVDRMEGVEQRVEDIEKWDNETKDVLPQTLQIQENIQAKLTNLEARS